MLICIFSELSRRSSASVTFFTARIQWMIRIAIGHRRQVYKELAEEVCLLRPEHNGEILSYDRRNTQCL